MKWRHARGASKAWYDSPCRAGIPYTSAFIDVTPRNSAHGTHLATSDPNHRNSPSTRREANLLVLAALLALDLLMFGDVLLLPGNVVASSEGGDVRAYFAPVRAFGFGELAHGNLPLWNPYTYSGTPFLAAFQPALLYPLNLHYLVLPLAKSLNLEIALHVYLAGAFFFLWARRWNVAPVPAGFGAAVLMFSGAYFPHVMAGHLSLVSAWAWAPLAFFALDSLLMSRKLSFAFLGAFALTMSIYAGHPQAAFETGVVLALYGGIRLAATQDRLRLVPGLVLLFFAPAVLAAAQLWPALALAPESVRAGGLSLDVARRFSFPPENAITLIAPKFFGDSIHSEYWGRWYFWEMSAFIGVTGVALAAYGAATRKGSERFLWGAMVVVAATLALGGYTPVFRILHAVVPGFDQFRSPSKFIFFATMFTCMLAACGADTLLRDYRRVRVLALVAACLAILVLIGVVTAGERLRAGAWSNLVSGLDARDGVFLQLLDGKLPEQFVGKAESSLLIAAASAALLATLLYFAPGRTWCGPAVLVLGLIEVFVFARSVRPTVLLDSLRNIPLDTFLETHPGDYRVWNLGRDNNLLAVRAHDFWGYDPAALRRYIELFARANGTDVADTLNEIWFDSYHPLFDMVRCKYVCDSGAGKRTLKELPGPLPRFLFPPEVRVITDPEERLTALTAKDFNPRSTIVLEQPPDPKPDAGGTGTVKILDESTDSVSMEIDLPRAAVMLMTDAYAPDWHVESLGDGPQKTYNVFPANHALRAIPLAAGHHRIRMEYAPSGFYYGAWATIVGGVLFIAFWVRAVRREGKELANVRIAHAG